MDASNERIARPKTRNPTGGPEDYVDLPKINFMQHSGSTSKEGKNSELNMEVQAGEEESNTGLRSVKADSSEEE
jgi:hypothetical protein